jgi:hypothetical protein
MKREIFSEYLGDVSSWYLGCGLSRSRRALFWSQIACVEGRRGVGFARNRAKSEISVESE